MARLLNRDPRIIWWHRLHRQDDAYLYYTTKDRYFPDFVAFDDAGVRWIIEGKMRAGETTQPYKQNAKQLRPWFAV